MRVTRKDLEKAFKTSIDMHVGDQTDITKQELESVGDEFKACLEDLEPDARDEDEEEESA